MHTSLRTLIVAVALGVSPVILFAAGVNPIVGTWQLNLAKSKYRPGPAPRSLTRTYVETAQGLFLTYDGADADGNATVGTHTIKLDGKDYPEPDAPDYDSASSTQIDKFTIQVDQKKHGKVVAWLTYVVAADRKEMTLSKRGVDAKGIAFDIQAVYDRL